MPDEFLYDVFLSHSAKDEAAVRVIAERLLADGLRVWFAGPEVRAGDDIVALIEEGLERSRVLVLCMSAHAFGDDWPRLEAGTFRFRDPLNKERRFIPLRLDDAPVKGSLVSSRAIDWRGDRELSYRELLEACQPSPSRSIAEAVASGEPGTVRAIRIETGGWTIWAYAFSPEGERVLVGGPDGHLSLWDLGTRKCALTLEGHKQSVRSLALSADQRHALSGSGDGSVWLWDLRAGCCLHVFESYSGDVKSVAWSPDEKYFVAASHDGTSCIWSVQTHRSVRLLADHSGPVLAVAWSPDQRWILSGSADSTARLWEVQSGRCLRVFEGHANSIRALSWSTDQRRALTASNDGTVRLWDVHTGRCLRVLEGHTHSARSVDWRPGGHHALSGSEDRTVRLWDVDAGSCLCVLKDDEGGIHHVRWSGDRRRAFSGGLFGNVRVWEISSYLAKGPSLGGPRTHTPSPIPDQVQYTNAKILLVGESGAGKTGLTERLAHDTFTPSYATSGTWSTQWQMKDLPAEPGWEREIWLWDFGGQADQRLVHQLYLDKTALVLLIFNADRDVVLPGLREWQQALSRAVPERVPTFLVAGRIDVGFRFDREKVRAFAREHGYRYFETSASDGRNCPELRQAIQADIPWTQLERRTSPTTWKLLKDEILRLRDEGQVLFTFKELREVLRQRSAGGMSFTDTDLETVVGLLDGPGVVKELGFGTYVLLLPEWINAYAQTVIRTLRAEAKGLGCLPVQSIAAGKLIFQALQANGEVVEEKRLGAREEPIVLEAMEQMLLERRLCLRQEGNLVFPSYCGIEKPAGPIPLKHFIRYTFGGFLDDVYATLVVRLTYCGAFRLKELWRDAADFESLGGRGSMGLKLLRHEDGQGTLLVHFSRNLTPQERVIFANYIHEHLVGKATEVRRLRFYVCPHCDTSVKDGEEAMRRLAERGKEASILCVHCEKRVPLWDNLEELFASDESRWQVEALQRRERFALDARRKGKLLALEVAARITSADQKCFEIPGPEDEGLDLEVEFTDDEGRGTGERIFLQLKAGNSYLERRARDGEEIFRIKEQHWVEYWLKQDRPVLLVVGTFPDELEDLRTGSEERFADIRWMEIGELLRNESQNGKRPVKQIVFRGERLDTLSVRRWRETFGRQRRPPRLKAQ